MRTGTTLAPATPPEQPTDPLPLLLLAFGFATFLIVGEFGHWYYAAMIAVKALQALTAYFNRGRGFGR
ncbi:hypothetical protein ACFXPS_27275 [Nocardia sp. NPDC059091]|uniref:hypothetical protein n=1 Tax=unclassified Nocardia TaxID=2637762 RepID=UPI0036B5B31E